MIEFGFNYSIKISIFFNVFVPGALVFLTGILVLLHETKE